MLGFYRAGFAVRNLGLGSHIRVTSHKLQSKFRDERWGVESFEVEALW